MISKEYRSVLKTMHDSGNWGATGRFHTGDLFLERLLEWSDVKTVLDFGCGKGTMRKFLEQNHPHIAVSEYDPGIVGKDTLPTGMFDAVISSDVLEHIEPPMLTRTLEWLGELSSSMMMHDIACYPTRKFFSDGPYAGQDLHLILEQPPWWRAQFEEVLNDFEEVEFQSRELKTRRLYAKTRCLLVHKRI